MRSNIFEVASVRYKPPYGDTFVHRSYQRVNKNGTLNYNEMNASATWVFCSSNCPYKRIKTKCLYSGLEYPYPLNKYGDKEINLRYWK